MFILYLPSNCSENWLSTADQAAVPSGPEHPLPLLVYFFSIQFVFCLNYLGMMVVVCPNLKRLLLVRQAAQKVSRSCSSNSQCLLELGKREIVSTQNFLQETLATFGSVKASPSKV